MILQLINDSGSLQAIIWGVIAVFAIKYLPPLIREFIKLSDKVNPDEQK